MQSFKEIEQEITRISKEFAQGLTGNTQTIAGTGALIVDPLSAYLNNLGYKNTLKQLPANHERTLILVMEFEGGATFIPAGSDMPVPGATDWLWLYP